MKTPSLCKSTEQFEPLNARGYLFMGSLRHALGAFLVLVQVWTRERVAILSKLNF